MHLAPSSAPFRRPDESLKKEPYVVVDPQPLERQASRSWTTPWRNILNRIWFTEFVAVIVAFVFLVLVFCVLAVFNAKPIDETGTSIWSSLPISILNFLVSSMRTAMLVPVASAVAQLKWTWFRRYRTLADIEVYDDATRGVVGSVMMLTKRRFWYRSSCSCMFQRVSLTNRDRHLAGVGALLTVFSLILETVVAQSIYLDYNGGPLPYQNASWSVPRTNRYEWWKDLVSNDEMDGQVPIVAIQAAVDYGVSYSMSYEGANPLAAPDCPTGYCEFGPYQTLGIDSMCADISDKIESNGQDFYIPSNAGLSSPLSLAKDGGLINATISFQYPDVDWFPHLYNVGPLISNSYIISAWNASLGRAPFAAECLMFWTIFKNNASFDPYGSFDEISMSNWTAKYPVNQTAYAQETDIIMTPPECYVNGSVVTERNLAEVADPVDGISECVYFIRAYAQYALQNYLGNSVYGLVGDYVDGPCDGCYRMSNKFPAYLAQLLDYAPTSDPVADIDNYIFSSLAYFMTAAVRQLPRRAIAITGRDGTYTMPAQGIMFDVDRFRVRWAVMIFPTFLLIACALFALDVAIRSREHIWKRSNLPLLFHGLSTRDRAQFGEILEYGDMKERAKLMNVCFQNSNEGYRFVSWPRE